jgi:hypothetical protein
VPNIVTLISADDAKRGHRLASSSRQQMRASQRPSVARYAAGSNRDRQSRSDGLLDLKAQCDAIGVDLRDLRLQW